MDHSNPKNFVADFSTSRKKGNIVFRNEGGGSEAVWKFSENSSILGKAGVPKGCLCLCNEFFGKKLQMVFERPANKTELKGDKYEENGRF